MFFQVNVVQIVGHDEEKRNVAVTISSPSSKCHGNFNRNGEW